jgi:hypothetical protein
MIRSERGIFTLNAQSPIKVLATEPAPTEALSWTDPPNGDQSVQPERKWCSTAARAFTFAQLRGILNETDVHALATPLTRNLYNHDCQTLNLQPEGDAHHFFDLTEDHVQNAVIQAAVQCGLGVRDPMATLSPKDC